ncbi:MAG TPA: tetratricopeptide repeat protein [Terriglobales bacterium]|nr:tetratricopeptide repeat protein [Terriglobales bacterium]
MNCRSAEIPDEFLAQLKEDLVCRRVARGLSRLEEHNELFTAFDPEKKNAGLFAGYLAQWVDVGFQRPGLVKEIVARFSKEVRARLPLCEYLHLRMAEGMVAMAEESKDEAIRHLEFVLGLEEETDDKEVMSIANFWKGRCLRMKGEYDQSLAFAVKGRELASELGHKPMAAVMRVLESWLFFQKGNAKQAIDILQEAESVLRKTDDYLTLGNIHSSYGRIARRQGRYQHAIDNFGEAIELYKMRDPRHRNVARSLNNMAYVKRLIALQLRRKIDSEAARRRKAAMRGRSGNGQVKSHYRNRFEQLRREALAELDEAAAIYGQYENYHGLGSVNLNYAYLYLDNGDLDHAQAAAETAFRLGEEKRDSILMARARLLLCMIENGRVEEGIGESTEPGSHARLAQDYSQEAVDLARHTQNRRLLAHTLIWQGLTQCNRFFDDPDAARSCYDQVIALSKEDHADSAWEDLQALKAKVLRSGSVNPTLRAWSQGSVGDKTFQQISEEFAELVVPKVWEREGRKISRVAARLSMSPKKVRRILNRARPSKPRSRD